MFHATSNKRQGKKPPSLLERENPFFYKKKKNCFKRYQFQAIVAACLMNKKFPYEETANITIWPYSVH